MPDAPTFTHQLTATIRHLIFCTRAMPPKRKLTTTSSSSAAAPKKKLQTTLAPPKSVRKPAIPSTEAIDYDHYILNTKYYPPVLTNTRCTAYASGELPKPISELTSALTSTSDFRARVEPGHTVIHWLRTDLRIDDNTALHMAAKLAAGEGTAAAVIGLYIFSPEDFEAHLVSPARVDFILRSLDAVREYLAELDIPLWVEVVEKRHEIPARIMALAQLWGAKHVFANMEYEVDELRRDARVVRLGEKHGVAVNVVHDTCVIPPGELLTKSTGKAFAVYTPWYKAFLARLAQEPALLTLHPPPPKNPVSTRTTFATLFTSPTPSPPANKTLTPAEKKVVHTLFPASSHEAHTRLSTFLSTVARAYATDRNIPSKPGTSVLSPYFAAGTLSARTAIALAKATNNGKLAAGQSGLDTWISEVAWRDFYKHVLVAFPHICMNKPFKPEFASITWAAPALSEPRFKAWTDGSTGYPLVDAGMRQLRAQKWVPNRVRMVVASFLAKDLHVDWRRGERYFSEHLVDGDFASNNGGWGFASSAGVDPQPYFRIFNPTTQSEKFDPDGEYIKTWVPELKGVKGKEVHNPSKETRVITGYCAEIVAHDIQRKLTVEIYKEGIERGKKVV